MLSKTTARVANSTAQPINERIQAETESRVAQYAKAGRQPIDQRLAELDREWDIERTLQANAATLALTGVLLGATVDRRWLWLPGIVTGFLLQHALQGWCPPLPVFRRLGFRTQTEIEQERYALKALRGDFRGLPTEYEGHSAVSEVLQAVRH
jgi:hypothetical protein